MKAAALQFSVAHPAAAAVIPGLTRADHVKEDIATGKEGIPADFWLELREQNLVSGNAPLPIDEMRECRRYNGGFLFVNNNHGIEIS